MGGYNRTTAKTQFKIGYSGPTGTYVASAKYDNRNLGSSNLSNGSVFGGAMIGKKHMTAEKLRAFYQKRGAVHISETHGTVSDPDVVGVGHITWQTDGVARVIFGAIVRKLLLKAGVTVDSATQEIPFSNPDLSNGFKLIYETIDNAGVMVATDQAIADNESINTLFSTTSAGLGKTIWDQIRDSTNPKLQKVYLYEFNNVDGGPQNRINSMVNLKEEKITCTVSSMITVQNRTLSLGGSTLTDSSNAQPVKGPAFEFSGVPRTKQVELQPLNTFYDEGVILFRKAQVTAVKSQGWAEPPVRNSFSNCVRGSYVRLPVGQLKNMALSKTWTGTYEKIMTKWRFSTEGADAVNIAPGVSQVVFFEEEINSGSANKLTIGYECQHTMGCVLTTSRHMNMQPDYAAYEASNN